jgi:hypothetical protein
LLNFPGEPDPATVARISADPVAKVDLAKTVAQAANPVVDTADLIHTAHKVDARKVAIVFDVAATNRPARATARRLTKSSKSSTLVP